MSELKRQTNGHGYPDCECDLLFDPECHIQPPYETVGAYIERLLERIATNAELLRLLGRHHKESLIRDRFLRAGTQQYIESELFWKTEAAIKPTEGAAMKDAYGLGDQLRPRVPTWTCPACKMKFHTRAEYDAHRAEESALKERV